jgi:hypothetical protein
MIIFYLETTRVETSCSSSWGSVFSVYGDSVMPQIWMTYDEIAGLLGCSADAARAKAVYRSLDRKKSRDGLTRVKLDSDWTAHFVAAIRDTDPALDEAIHGLQTIHGEMAHHAGQLTESEAASHQASFATKHSG